MEISNRLLYLFNADIHTEDDRYVVEVPRREVEAGTAEPGETYRVTSISRESNEPAGSGSNAGPTPMSEPQPSAEAGELRYVEVEDIGKQGDGITRVERGYIIIVPGTEVDERVKVEITEVKSNLAIGEIVEDGF